MAVINATQKIIEVEPTGYLGTHPEWLPKVLKPGDRFNYSVQTNLNLTGESCRHTVTPFGDGRGAIIQGQLYNETSVGRTNRCGICGLDLRIA